MSRNRKTVLKQIVMLYLSVLWLFLLYLSPAQAQTSFEFDQVVYHTCYDGDTCMVSLPGVHPFFGDHILIRLDGIEPPRSKVNASARYDLPKKQGTSFER
jgi:endonuclease YncB( thermonuclease family)